MLGAKRDNREISSRSRKLLGIEHWVGGTSEIVQVVLSNYFLK